MSTTLADSLIGLAIVCRQSGNFDEAKKLYERSLDIRTKLLGEEHEQVGQCYNGLGCLYQDLSQLTQAEECFTKVS